MNKIKPSGFTLIELLIVVAIIAILAAIAIPNFLAAQVRSKVSNAKAGMRTVATAIEAYYVDYNDYPPAYFATTSISGAFGSNNYQVPFEITTPIAYLSSLPRDPFDRFETANPVALRTLRYRRPGWGYQLSNTGGKILTTISLYVPAGFPNDLDPYPGTIPAHFYGTSSPASASPIAWAMWSVGPDGDFESESGVQPCRLHSWYDPTNGVVSNGNISRFSSGLVVP